MKTRKKRMITISCVPLFVIAIGIVMYMNRLKIYGEYQVKDIPHVSTFTSFSYAGWKEVYLGAEITVGRNSIIIKNNDGTTNELEKITYSTHSLADDEELLQKYKDLFLGMEDEFVETIETSYVIKQEEESSMRYMIWEAADKLYFVEYVVGEKDSFISYVFEIGDDA